MTWRHPFRFWLSLSAQARRDLVWTMIGYVGPLVLSSSASVAIGRLLGATGKGELAGIQLLPMMALGIVSVGLPYSASYFIAKDPDKTGEITGTTLAFGLLLALVGTIVVAVSQPFFLRQFDRSTRISGVIYSLFIPLGILTGVPLSALLSNQRYKAWNLLRLMPQVTFVGVVCITLVIGIRSAGFITSAYVLVLGTIGVFLVRTTYQKEVDAALSVNWTLVPKLLRYGGLVILTTAPGMLQADQTVIAMSLSPAELGRYSVGVTWAGLASLPTQVVSAQLWPRLPGASPDRARHLLRVGVTGGIVLSALMGFLLAVSVWIIPLVFGRDFAGAAKPFQVLAAAGAFNAASQLFADYLRGLGRPGIPAISQWVAVSISVIGLVSISHHPSLLMIATVTLVASAVGFAVDAVGLTFVTRYRLD